MVRHVQQPAASHQGTWYKVLLASWHTCMWAIRNSTVESEAKRPTLFLKKFETYWFHLRVVNMLLHSCNYFEFKSYLALVPGSGLIWEVPNWCEAIFGLQQLLVIGRSWPSKVRPKRSVQEEWVQCHSFRVSQKRNDYQTQYRLNLYLCLGNWCLDCVK